MRRYILDPDKPHKLAASDPRRLDLMTDADIDYSDIPELNESFFENAKVVNGSPTKPELPKKP